MPRQGARGSGKTRWFSNFNTIYQEAVKWLQRHDTDVLKTDKDGGYWTKNYYVSKEWSKESWYKLSLEQA